MSDRVDFEYVSTNPGIYKINHPSYKNYRLISTDKDIFFYFIDGIINSVSAKHCWNNFSFTPTNERLTTIV